MTSKTLFHGDCLDMLDAIKSVDCIFMDPPDNLGLAYQGFNDNRKAEDYYNWLEIIILKSLRLAPVVWVSYYWEHDLELKHRVRNILKFRHPAFNAKTFLWRYTFGQYNDKDCGSGFRYLLRLSRANVKWDVDPIRVPSRRMEIGDARAAGPKVPDDVWDFSRVVGNAQERRAWHPTQHPELLMKRIYDMTPGTRVVDLFGGTGTSFRVCPWIEKDVLISEISKPYVQELEAEHRLTAVTDPSKLEGWV